MANCKICNKQTIIGKYCCSNCWNKDHREAGRKSCKKCYDKNPIKRLEQNKKWIQLHPIKMKEYMAIEYKKNPEKRKAWRKDYLLRKDKCELCGLTKSLEYHHLDYSNNIGITLCKGCHLKKHNRILRRMK